MLVVAGGTRREIGRAQDLANELGLSGRVQFLGVVSDVERLMNAADALALPSRFEAWPLVGLEAMACGLPILMTPVGGVSEFLDHGVNGLFIEPNPQSVARAIECIYSADPVRREGMRHEAYKTAMRYSWDEIAKRYAETLVELFE